MSTTSCGDGHSHQQSVPTCEPTQAYVSGRCVDTRFVLGEVVIADSAQAVDLPPGKYALAIVDTDVTTDNAVAFPLRLDGSVSDPPASITALATTAGLTVLPRVCATPSLASRPHGVVTQPRSILSAIHAAPNYAIGDRRTFYVPDLNSSINTPREAELRATGTYVNFWEDVSQTSAGTLLTDTLLEELIRRLDQGVVPREIAIFGPFTDVDGNGKLDAYFTSVLTDPSIAAFVWEDTLLGPNANTDYGEVIYSTLGEDAGATASLLAHEMQHLIAVGQQVVAHLDDPGGAPAMSDDVYVLEGLAELAVHWSGQGGARLASVALQYPGEFSLQRMWQNDYASDDVENIVQYGIAALLLEYLFDQAGAVAIVGPGVVEDLGGEALTRALTNGTLDFTDAQAQHAREVADWYTDFVVALLLTTLADVAETTSNQAEYRFVAATSDDAFGGYNGAVFTWEQEPTLATNRTGPLLQRRPWSQHGLTMYAGGMGFYSLAVGIDGATLNISRPTTQVALLRYAQP